MSVTAVPIRPIRKGSVAKLLLGIALLSGVAGAAAWRTTGGLIYEKSAGGTEYQVIDRGEGASPGANDIATIHVTTRVGDRVVENSRTGEPPEVPIGQLPPWLSEVVRAMSKGATYKVRPTPEQVGAPPGTAARLTLELTLVDFRTLSAEEQRQMEMMRMLQQQMQQGGAPGGPGGPEGPGGPGGAPGAGAPEPAPAPPPTPR